jgi:hypothetical protein
MRYTLDTNIITIRDVFAMKSQSDTFIEYDSFPVIGHEGHLDWKTPLEFLGGMSCLGTTVLQLLEAIQPGLSTLSTNFTKVRDFMLMSTVAGLGETYVSSAFLSKKITELSSEIGYISSTTLYDCLNSLSRLNTITNWWIGPMVLHSQARGNTFASHGYVTTENPGGFHNYYSTIGFTNSPINTTMGGTIIAESLDIDLGGFPKLNSSKMRLDIDANVNVSYIDPPKLQSFSTFLYNGTRPVGTPVVVNYENLAFNTSKFTYFLTAEELGWPLTGSLNLQLRHRITNDGNTDATITVVPIGIYARLINMD